MCSRCTKVPIRCLTIIISDADDSLIRSDCEVGVVKTAHSHEQKEPLVILRGIIIDDCDHQWISSCLIWLKGYPGEVRKNIIYTTCDSTSN